MDLPGFPRMALPRVAPVRQRFAVETLSDLEGAIRSEFERAGLAGSIRPGARVAITAGSRGIAEIARILRLVGQLVREAGGEPFAVPSMGSHGGATVEGQLHVLENYGVTEAGVGMPIRASMETVELGRIESGSNVYMDRHAYEADHTIVVARVKNHTSFRSDVESGLCKMIAIGLGKQRGAEAIHETDLPNGIKLGTELALRKANHLMALAIVENANHQPYLVRVVGPGQYLETDRELLKLSNSLLPRIPFEHLDVLVVQQIGKNISGTGMDPNIIGMWRRTEEGPRVPDFRRIVALDLTPETEGNGMGVGLADFTTERLTGKLVPHKSYMNALTANALVCVRVPLVLATDRLALEVALKSATPKGAPRLAWIRNTLELDRMLLSEALLDEVRHNERIEVLGEPRELPFNAADELEAERALA